MATSYSTLKTEIGGNADSWTHRTISDARLDDFIDKAEAYMNRVLRVSDMEESTAVAVTTADISLPTGFLEMREIHVSGSPDQTLEFVTPFKLTAVKASGDSGKPKFYTIQANAIEVYPVGDYTVEMVFYKGITPLDNTNTSNFVLASNPDVYMHGTLYYAFAWMRDFDGAGYHKQEFDRLLAEMNTNSNRKKFSGSPLQVVAV